MDISCRANRPGCAVGGLLRLSWRLAHGDLLAVGGSADRKRDVLNRGKIMKWNDYSKVQPEAVKTVVLRAKLDGGLNPYTYRICTGLEMAICGLNSQWKCCDIQWLYIDDIETPLKHIKSQRRFKKCSRTTTQNRL